MQACRQKRSFKKRLKSCTCWYYINIPPQLDVLRKLELEKNIISCQYNRKLQWLAFTDPSPCVVSHPHDNQLPSFLNIILKPFNWLLSSGREFIYLFIFIYKKSSLPCMIVYWPVLEILIITRNTFDNDFAV
jgi:hypothetical protein